MRKSTIIGFTPILETKKEKAEKPKTKKEKAEKPKTKKEKAEKLEDQKKEE